MNLLPYQFPIDFSEFIDSYPVLMPMISDLASNIQGTNVLHTKGGRAVLRVPFACGKTVIVKLWPRGGARLTIRLISRTSVMSHEARALRLLYKSGVAVPRLLASYKIPTKSIPFRYAMVMDDLGPGITGTHYIQKNLRECNEEALDQFDQNLIEITNQIIQAKFADTDHSVMNFHVPHEGPPVRLDFEQAHWTPNHWLGARLYGQMVGRLIATHAFAVQPHADRISMFVRAITYKLECSQEEWNHASMYIDQLMTKQKSDTGIDTRVELSYNRTTSITTGLRTSLPPKSRHTKWPYDYLLVLSNGKSGSKRVLKMLDLSDETHCRCEPNELAGSPLRACQATTPFDPHLPHYLRDNWDRGIEWTHQRIGDRDHFPTFRKRHHYHATHHLQLWRPMHHTGIRRMIGMAIPSWRTLEWPLPFWIGRRRLLRNALLVIKLNQIAHCLPWLIHERPNVAILHVIRHPGAFLFSYTNRWLRDHDAHHISHVNRARLQAIVRRQSYWAERFPSIDRMSAKESELWFWLYCAETIHDAAKGHGPYMLIKDEDVVSNPISAAKEIYSRYRIPWHTNITHYLTSMEAHWRSHTAPWRDLLNPQDTDLVDRILETSRIRDLWSPDQRVSRHDYVAY